MPSVPSHCQNTLYAKYFIYNKYPHSYVYLTRELERIIVGQCIHLYYVLENTKICRIIFNITRQRHSGGTEQRERTKVTWIDNRTLRVKHVEIILSFSCSRTTSNVIAWRHRWKFIVSHNTGDLFFKIIHSLRILNNLKIKKNIYVSFFYLFIIRKFVL